MGQANNKPAQSSTNKHQAARAAAKKAKTKKILITVAVVLAAVLIITPLALFANGSVYRLANAATVGDIKFSVAEYNYFYQTSFVNTYNNFYNTYGEYASQLLDPDTPLDEQTYSDGVTWADHFRDAALSDMQEVAMLY